MIGVACSGKKTNKQTNKQRAREKGSPALLLFVPGFLFVD